MSGYEPLSVRPATTMRGILKIALAMLLLTALMIVGGIATVALLGRQGDSATWARWGNVGQSLEADDRSDVDEIEPTPHAARRPEHAIDAGEIDATGCFIRHGGPSGPYDRPLRRPTPLRVAVRMVLTGESPPH